MDEWFLKECQESEVALFWASTEILAGLKFSANVVTPLIPRRDQMRESTTYQAILEEGSPQEAKALVLSLGKRCLGEPTQEALAKIQSAQSTEWLRELYA